MKKQLLTLGLSLLTMCFSFAQTTNKCATMPVYQQHMQNPVAKANFINTENAARQWLANPANKANALKKQNSIITIPVVVHVVYKNAAQNIPDSQIVRQIQILNTCYRLQNANYPTGRAIFDSIAADVEIQFCLAATDPSGNPTTGIIRKSAPSSAAFDPLTGFDNVKSSATDGDDPWPNDKYLNIWVCDMSVFGFTFVLGYATFPGESPALDGVVIQSEYFGYGNAMAPNNLGRTTVHEVGHYLGMRHIWADDDGGSTGMCDSTDFVDDTPNQAAKSQSDCKDTNPCANEAPYWGTIDPPDLVQDYMDYSADGCMAMFTKGQKARMYSFLNTDPARVAIKTSPAGCNNVGVKELYSNFSDYLFVYPNPVSDNLLHINITQLTPANLKCEIYSSNGQLVKQINQLEFQNTINLSDLSSGMYVVKVFNGELTAIKKITISK